MHLPLNSYKCRNMSKSFCCKIGKPILTTRQKKYYNLITNKEKTVPIHQKHDKTYRGLLSNKKDVVYLLNKELKIKKEQAIKQEEIESYNTRFITEKFENREADIVYKMKNKKVFFLIEHQNKIDYNMPLRIEEYKKGIIESAIETRKSSK